MYVTGLPVPAGIPIDLAEADISIHDDRLYFCFTLYFYMVLKNALQAEDFRKIHEERDLEWFPTLRESYRDVTARFGLRWDVEYDESIEDSLYGNFKPDAGIIVIEIVRALSGRMPS